MKKWILLTAAAGLLAASSGQKTFTGTITDSMCGTKHNMGISPVAKCVRYCVNLDPKKWKYALQVGSKVYVLSDQQTPEKFAAQKVKITGKLYAKTGIIAVEKIEPAR